MSIRACIFSRLASIPQWLTIKPRNLSKAIPNTHFNGFNFIQFFSGQQRCRRDARCGLQRSLTRRACRLRRPLLFANLFPEHHIDEMLVSRFDLLETEWHDLVAVEPAVYDEGSVFLIGYMHWNLVVPKVSVHEAQQCMT